MAGELDAGNPHVQFDEGAQETYDSATRLCPTLPQPLAMNSRPELIADDGQGVLLPSRAIARQRGRPTGGGIWAGFTRMNDTSDR